MSMGLHVDLVFPIQKWTGPSFLLLHLLDHQFHQSLESYLCQVIDHRFLVGLIQVCSSVQYVLWHLRRVAEGAESLS